MTSLKILKRKQYFKQSNCNLEAVLCNIACDYYPFVTWIYDNKTSNFSNGHYFETLHKAYEDFDKREGDLNDQSN